METRPVNIIQYINDWSTKKLAEQAPAAEKKEHEVSSDSDTFMDEHEELELQRKKQKMKRKPTKKLAISAEAYGEYNQVESY